jgi:hypothetical protein
MGLQQGPDLEKTELASKNSSQQKKGFSWKAEGLAKFSC